MLLRRVGVQAQPADDPAAATTSKATTPPPMDAACTAATGAAAAAAACLRAFQPPSQLAMPVAQEKPLLFLLRAQTLLCH